MAARVIESSGANMLGTCTGTASDQSQRRPLILFAALVNVKVKFARLLYLLELGRGPWRPITHSRSGLSWYVQDSLIR
jgi:hypothetical protein